MVHNITILCADSLHHFNFFLPDMMQEFDKAINSQTSKQNSKIRGEVELHI